ncbi:isocitrate dehydrogenase (NAD+) [Alkalispirillum mobile]|uniref:Isocitrate dehydrogenase (NAD+) n=1 Tax=Alkalispirillum mobile TaxID=85925 RepID=A0A498CFD6_9GAMM|nr:isocitrate dehydrogenase [Alkalispirillum mobile]RLK51058.1 isocitrate dehydrogenase (NAD+) [Alkalispirillum mobile]
MASRKITVLPGDGIGPDIVEATIRVLDRLGCGLEYEYADVGLTALEQGRELIPQEALDTIERNGIVLKGPITTPVGEGFTSVNVSLRKHFQLFANVRPVITIPGTRARYENIDIITVRENTEGMYSGVGQTLSEDGNTAEARSVITREESLRLVRFAFDMARRLGRQQVTVVHKANILKTTSGLFLKCAREVAEQYPDIEMNEMIVDACCMKLVMNPEQFDVIVTTNLFGDIISDLCAGLVGGLGMAPGANIGEDKALFEAVHGSAPDIAGQNIANPTAMMLAAALMLDHMEMHEPASRMRTAIRNTIFAGDRVTPDLGGHGSTSGFTDAVIERV